MHSNGKLRQSHNRRKDGKSDGASRNGKTVLVRKNISSVVCTWKLLLDFVLKTGEKKRTLMLVNLACFYRNG